MQARQYGYDKAIPSVIRAMVEDVYREGKGEIVEGNEVQRMISQKAAILYKKMLSDDSL